MLQQATIIALLVLSIWYTYQEGEIFEGIAKWFEKNTPSAIHPALFDCNICMTPWYGSVLYLLIYELWLNVASLPNWFVVVICAMGINVVVNKFTAKDEIDVNNHY